jgi:ankyrin repeat protein
MNDINNYKFIAAVRNNEIELIKQLVESKTINPTFDDNFSLQIACKYGFLELLKFLVNIPEVIIKEDYNLFSYGVKSGSVKIINFLLLQPNCNPNEKTDPLEQAVKFGYTDIVKSFLNDKRISPEINENWLIRQAHYCKRYEVVRLLFKNKYVKETLQTQFPDFFELIIKELISDKITSF